MRILVVEDEVRLATLLRKGLTEEGHGVDLAGSGEEALDRVAVTDYDVIVLDVMLPGIDGFAVCQHLRQDRVHTPILLLTARDAIRDRVVGLDVGADDYLVKPFAFAELAGASSGALPTTSRGRAGSPGRWECDTRPSEPPRLARRA